MSYDRVKLWTVAMWNNRAVSAPAISTVLGFLYGHTPNWESVARLVHEDCE